MSPRLKFKQILLECVESSGPKLLKACIRLQRTGIFTLKLTMALIHAVLNTHPCLAKITNSAVSS